MRPPDAERRPAGGVVRDRLAGGSVNSVRPAKREVACAVDVIASAVERWQAGDADDLDVFIAAHEATRRAFRAACVVDRWQA